MLASNLLALNKHASMDVKICKLNIVATNDKANKHKLSEALRSASME